MVEEIVGNKKCEIVVLHNYIRREEEEKVFFYYKHRIVRVL